MKACTNAHSYTTTYIHAYVAAHMLSFIAVHAYIHTSMRYMAIT